MLHNIEIKIELVLVIASPWFRESRLGGIGQDVFLGSSHALDFERAGEAELPRYESNRPWVSYVDTICGGKQCDKA